MTLVHASDWPTSTAFPPTAKDAFALKSHRFIVRSNPWRSGLAWKELHLQEKHHRFSTDTRRDSHRFI